MPFSITNPYWLPPASNVMFEVNGSLAGSGAATVTTPGTVTSTGTAVGYIGPGTTAAVPIALVGACMDGKGFYCQTGDLDGSKAATATINFTDTVTSWNMTLVVSEERPYNTVNALPYETSGRAIA